MRYVRVKNQDLCLPYCYVHTIFNTYEVFRIDWEEIDGERFKLIDDYILFLEDGYVFTEKPYGFLDNPIGYFHKSDWKEYILPIAGSPEFPSAELRSYRTNKLLKKSYLEKNKKKEEKK